MVKKSVMHRQSTSNHESSAEYESARLACDEGVGLAFFFFGSLEISHDVYSEYTNSRSMVV
ncbi:hypothetical protein BELL_0665g00040 [Botrytis elliptica]|uniref:Uncharacterized protein n=1 Tax=Botrytis elliptica TaxID=278938 RepID=A0A4Z1JNB0_9HELO|nr:hypothetical protein BELL_0665g00040 [Botrytis elliptica]